MRDIFRLTDAQMARLQPSFPRATVSRASIITIFGTEASATYVDLFDPARHVPACGGCRTLRAFLEKSPVGVLLESPLGDL